MRIPENLEKAFGPGPGFERFLADFAVSHNILPEIECLSNRRYLSRSIAPHILKLSNLFNRREVEQGDALAPYWKQGNTSNLRLAYFLYFMPANLARIAAIWSELHRLGFKWNPKSPLRGIEFGAGPASGATGIAFGEGLLPLGLPKEGNWALIEQDGATLELGKEWATHCFTHNHFPWEIRGFQRKIELGRGFLPRSAPKFSLWLMSFFLNEMDAKPDVLAQELVQTWKRHIEQEGLIILVEPALKQQSRRLLELRRELLEQKEFQGDFQILLPCLGHQSCGALANDNDWCHEEITWWRPPYFRILDELVGLDRKTLPFSYLVIARSKRTRSEILPALASTHHHRLVSPAHEEGRELEFFLCGQEGKRRARIKPSLLSNSHKKEEAILQRGDILAEAELRGATQASRVDHVKKVI